MIKPATMLAFFALAAPTSINAAFQLDGEMIFQEQLPGPTAVGTFGNFGVTFTYTAFSPPLMGNFELVDGYDKIFGTFVSTVSDLGEDDEDLFSVSFKADIISGEGAFGGITGELEGEGSAPESGLFPGLPGKTTLHVNGDYDENP